MRHRAGLCRQGIPWPRRTKSTPRLRLRPEARRLRRYQARAAPPIRHRAHHRTPEGRRSPRTLLSQRPCRRRRQRHPLSYWPQLPPHSRLAQRTLVPILIPVMAHARLYSPAQSGFLTNDQLAIDNMRANLTDPKRHAEALKAAHTEYATLTKKNSGEKVAAEKQISRLNVQISRLVDAIENSDKPVQELMASLQAKDAERVGLIERVRLLNSSNVVTLHPQVIETYRQNVDKLHEALSAETLDVDVVTAFRNLLDCIVVQPTGYRQPYVVDAYGRLSAIMGVNLFPTVRSGRQILEEEGVTVASAALAANHSGQVRRGNTCQ